MQSPEVSSDLVKVRRRDAKWVVGLDTEVEDNNRTRTRPIPKGTVSKGKLSCRTTGHSICSVLVWFRAAELESSCDDRVEEDDCGGDNCPAAGKGCREDKLEDGTY